MPNGVLKSYFKALIIGQKKRPIVSLALATKFELANALLSFVAS